jgi:hypothetical protein
LSPAARTETTIRYRNDSLLSPDIFVDRNGKGWIWVHRPRTVEKEQKPQAQIGTDNGSLLLLRLGHTLIGFNPGVYETIDLLHWIAKTPTVVLVANFSKPAALFEKFPHSDLFITPKGDYE